MIKDWYNENNWKCFGKHQKKGGEIKLSSVLNYVGGKNKLIHKN